MDFSEVTEEDGYDGLGLVPVRLRGDDDAGGWWGYSFLEDRWDWRADLGVLYSSTGFVPNLGADDCQENYWVVETAGGVRYAFQSIDVE